MREFVQGAQNGDYKRGDIIITMPYDLAYGSASFSNTDDYGYGYDTHIGFFWGDTDNPQIYWHSVHVNQSSAQLSEFMARQGLPITQYQRYVGVNDGNQASNFFPKSATDSVFWVLPLSSPEAEPEPESVQFRIAKTSRPYSGGGYQGVELTEILPSGYSLDGAVYRVYWDVGCTDRAMQLSLADGSGNVNELTIMDGYSETVSVSRDVTLYIKEYSPSLGHNLDPTIYMFHDGTWSECNAR